MTAAYNLRNKRQRETKDEVNIFDDSDEDYAAPQKKALRRPIQAGPTKIKLVAPSQETIKSWETIATDAEPAPPILPIMPEELTIELDEILSKLRARAVTLDQNEAFGPRFAGHVAQLNRDAHMYLLGMKCQIPKKWEWAVEEIVMKHKNTEMEREEDYRQFLAQAQHYGFALSDTLLHSELPNIYYETNEQHERLAETMMNKYKINDHGQPILAKPLHQNKKPRLTGDTFTTNIGQGRKLEKFFSNGNGGNNVTVFDNEEDVEETKKEIPSFLQPYRK
jgi:hypothetical protein